MSWFTTFMQRFGYVKTEPISNPAPWMLVEAEAERFSIPDGSLFTAQAELMQRLSWVNIAVSFIANASAVLPINIKKYQGDGEDSEDVTNHPFELLLRKPNPLQSRFEFLNSTVSWYCLTGNCYWWLNRSSATDEPEEIWILPSNKVEPVPDDKLYLRGYAYDAGIGRTIALEPWEIVHFKRYHPLNPWVGLSVIESIAMTAAGDLEMQKWNTKFFSENGGRLPGILAFASNINDGEWQKMKLDIADKTAKRQVMMLRNTQSGGVQWIQAASSQKDMDFLASRKANRQEIFDAFSPGLYGMLSENATEANARTAKATFTEFGLWPMLTMMAEKITNDLLMTYGPNLYAEFDDPRVTDRALEMQEQTIYAQVHTIDEIRAEYYEDDPIGDERGELLPAQVSPNTGAEPEPEAEPMPQPEQLQQEAQGGAVDEQEQAVEEVGEETGEGMSEGVKAEISRWRRKALHAVKRGKPANVEFETDVIPAEMVNAIRERLTTATDEGAVRAAFENYSGAVAPVSDFAALIAEMKRANDLLEKAYATPTD